MADDPYDILTKPLDAPPSAPASASAAPTTAPVDDDPYAVLTKPLLADPGREKSGYVSAGGGTTWSDVPTAVEAGVHGVGATGAGLAAVTARDTTGSNYWSSVAQQQEEEARQREAELTPAAQQPGFFSHPLVSTAEAAPGLAALGAPMALSGPFAPLVGAGIMAGQATGDTYNRMMDAAMAKGMSREDADRAIRASGALPASAAIGAATGLFPEVTGPLVGKIVTTPLIDRALGIATDAAGFGVSGAAQEYGTEKGEQKIGVRTDLDLSSILKAGTDQLATGAVMGGISGHPTRSPREYPKEDKPTDMTQKPGVSDSTTGGYSLDPAASPDKGGATPTVADTGPPPPAPKVDPAQAAALSPDPDWGKARKVAEVLNDPNRTEGEKDAATGALEKILTPRVTEPPTTPVEQPPVVQPTPPPSETGREAPPAVDTTGEHPTPQPPPEAGPTPVPAPPREDVGAIVPETPETLAAQHAALLDPGNSREMMLYPKGTQPIEIADKKAFGQFKLPEPDGRVVQFDKNGPNALSIAKIRQAVKDDRLNDYLQLGPVTKDEAISRVAGGEQGVGVTERTPAGTEVKAAAGTETTAPAQVADLEATKTPGNVVSVEPPEAVPEGRQAEIAQPREVVQPPVVDTNPQGKLTQTPFGPGRVLEAQDEASVRARNEAAFQEAQQARSVQEQLKAKQTAKEAAAAAEAGVKGRSHTAKVDQAKIANDNIGAQRIVDKYPAPERLDNIKRPTEIYDRAKAMVNEAKAAGIKIPETFPEGHPHNGAMLKLREAADLTASKTPKGGWDPYARFLDREHLIDTGKEKEAFEVRRNEGALGTGSVGLEGGTEGVRAKGGAVDEEGKPQEAPEEARAEAAHEETPTEHAGEGGEEEHVPLAGPTDAERLAQRMAERRAESEAMRAEAKAPAPKAAVGFKQEVKKSRAIKRQELEDEPHHIMATNSEGNPVGVEAQRSTTLSDALDEHYDPKNYSPEMRPMMDRLRDAVERRAGDKSAYYISHDDMLSLGERARGVADVDAGHVLLNADKMTHDTVLHEAFHMATAEGLKDPELKSLMGRLQDEMGVKGDPEEFLTRLMTDNKLQDQFKGEKVSPELARDIGIPKWRKATMWEAALNIIRRALGLGPRDVGAVEAAMALSEKAMWKKDPGMAMEAGARSLGLRFQKMDPPERDQEAFMKSPSEKVASIRGIDRDVAKQAVKDAAGNLGTSILSKTAKILSGTQLSDLHGKIFTDVKGNILEAINRARDKVSHTFNEARKGDRDTINRGYLLDQKYRSNMPAYAELVNMSARYNIHADRDPLKAPKGGPVDAPRKNWQGNANYDKARALYDKLPTELQARYRSEKQYYMDKQKELADTVLKKVLPVLDLPKDMEERVRNQDLTDEDWEKLADMKADTTIRNAQRLLNKKDVYFPGQRDGDFVVTGRYEMPKGGSATDMTGEQLADNKREFDTEAQAHAYVTDTHMPATVRETTYWTDPATGKTERKTAGEAASTGKITKKYEVSLERQHTEMHDSHAEAVKARAEMEKAGVGELSGVLDKRNERAWSSIGSGEQHALERRIMNRDNLTSVEKQHLIESTRQLALGSQNGMAPHLLGSRKVAGAKMDTAEGLDRYSRSINQFIARNSHSAELNQAMHRLDEHENTTRGDIDATTRSIIGNAMRDRVYDQSTGIDSKMSPLLHRLMTMSFINFLVRPSHIFLSQVHPYVYSVPMMAGRHGYWAAIRAQKQAMADLGGQLGNLGRGAKAGADVFKSLREKDTERAVQLAHGGDAIHDMINRLKDKGERDMLMQMYETQHLHSAYDSSMFKGGGIDRTNVMMQQFTNAMEANNRLSTALAAYRLEKGAHGDAPTALQYARRVIEETHGVYSASNTAPIFKNPLMRATLQFHQQPMNLAFMLYRNAFKAFKGDTEARWTLAYQLGTAALLGGMGGMPMDLPKLAGLATQPVTGMAPSDWDDKMRREMADTMGQTATNAIMDGLPGLMGPLGPSLGHRMGFDAGLINDEPKSASGGDIMAWAAKNVAGAPGGMLMDWLDGVHALEGGDVQKASEKFLPGSLKDFAKAYRLGTSGVQAGGKTIRPASYGDALLQTLGFSGVERERQTEGHYKLQEAIKNQPKTVAEQLKAKQAAKKAGNYPLGVKPNAKDASIVRDYRNAYQ